MCIKTGDWSKPIDSVYKAVQSELWLYGNIVMRNTRVVIPASLQKRILMLAHEGHQGIVRTKSRLRNKVWWPNIDKQVEKLVKSCHPCQLLGTKVRPEPLKPTPLPEGPWSNVAVDLLEIPGGNHILVVIDYFSRWPEVVNLKKTDALHVIRSLEAMFRTHGIPFSIRSDNGPPFTSQEFESFLEYLGIEHKKGVPYWPQSNGAVERFNETILKIIRTARIEKKNWQTELADFLFHYRSTPHTVTGVTPAELIMGRSLRGKIPKIVINLEERPTEADWQVLLRERDAKAKLKQKQYADMRRLATVSEIDQGDLVLLKQAQQKDKLSPPYEVNPYTVLEKNGNAVIIESKDGVKKMRNAGHLKRYNTSDSQEDLSSVCSPLQSDVSPDSSESVTQPVSLQLGNSSGISDSAISEPKPSIINVDKGAGVIPLDKDFEQDSSHQKLRRSARLKSKPSKLKDFVS